MNQPNAVSVVWPISYGCQTPSASRPRRQPLIWLRQHIRRFALWSVAHFRGLLLKTLEVSSHALRVRDVPPGSTPNLLPIITMRVRVCALFDNQAISKLGKCEAIHVLDPLPFPLERGID
jgi:hypothetical protein